MDQNIAKLVEKTTKMSAFEEFKEFMTDLVLPSQRANVTINPDHNTMLRGTKSKKQLSRKRPMKKSHTLTRSEFARLGLFTLPTKHMQYTEALPLHRLWRGYAKEHLALRPGATVPEVHEPRYDAFSKLLVKIDIHGAKMRVIESKCPTLVGLAGIVILDTKNVLKILGEDNRLRTVPKSECIFGMRLGNMDFTVFGKHLAVRPAERSVKKIKNCVEPFL